MTDTNGSGGSGSDDTGNDDVYPPNRVPQPTCVFSVCSCPPGWALNVDHANNQRCIEAPQPQGNFSGKQFPDHSFKLNMLIITYGKSTFLYVHNPTTSGYIVCEFCFSSIESFLYCYWDYICIAWV